MGTHIVVIDFWVDCRYWGEKGRSMCTPEGRMGADFMPHRAGSPAVSFARRASIQSLVAAWLLFAAPVAGSGQIYRMDGLGPAFSEQPGCSSVPQEEHAVM